jgi:hypothetical protein
MKHLILFFLILGNFTYSQAIIELNYKDTTTFISNHKTIFKIKDPNDKIVYKGEHINQFRFNIPGSYNVDIVELIDHKPVTFCKHYHFPKEMTINVSPFLVKFIDESLKVSNKIIKDINTNHLKLTIDVEVSSYNNQEIIMSEDVVVSSGVGSEIIARLDNRYKKLTPGKHKITYQLSGVCSEESYIMFDFVLPNGNIQAVPLSDKITNQLHKL